MGQVASILIAVLLPAWGAHAEPLSLEAALTQARAQNEQVELALLQVARARVAVDAAWAALYPTIRATGTWRINDREIIVGDRRVQRLTSVNGQAALEMQLFDGPALGRIDPAETRVKAWRAEAQWSQHQLDFAVADAWYAAVVGTSLRKAAQRGLNSANENLEVVQLRRAVGKALAVDEARAQLRVVTAQEDVTRAANVEASARDLLGLLVVADAPVEVANLETAQAISPAPLADDALMVDAERPDLRALRLLTEAAEQAVANAWMDFLPTVSMLGTWNVTNDGGFSGQNTAGALFLTLGWLIFDPTRTPRHADQRLLVDQAHWQAEAQQRQSDFLMRQARRDLSTVEATLVTAQQRRALATESRRQVHARYRAGRATALALVEAEDTLRRGELDVIARTLERYRARLAVLQGLGLDPLGLSPIVPAPEVAPMQAEPPAQADPTQQTDPPEATP
ncbi:MAG: outer membrane protein TolC [Bradymonadia bacterium]|jgi:outer membrane protein TolC